MYFALQEIKTNFNKTFIEDKNTPKNMEALYHQTNRIIHDIEQSFQKLVQTSGQQDSYEVENEIQTKITQVNS